MRTCMRELGFIVVNRVVVSELLLALEFAPLLISPRLTRSRLCQALNFTGHLIGLLLGYRGKAAKVKIQLDVPSVLPLNYPCVTSPNPSAIVFVV